jgi:hypothetical protein
MRSLAVLGSTLLLILVPPLAVEGQDPGILAVQYYQCTVGQESQADEIFQETLSPILEGMLASGSITNWGWLAHDTGGRWRRALYFGAADLDALFSARGAFIEEMQGEHAEAAASLNTVCWTHDDYMWTPAADQAPQAVVQDRPAVAISQYLKCDIDREGRADELTQEVFAPIYDRFVQSGAIAGWGWFAHMVGGEYRRLWTISGSDFPSLMTAWGEINAASAQEASSATREFNDICPSHVDYLWTTVASNP